MSENKLHSRRVLSDLDLTHAETLLLILERHSDLLLLVAQQVMDSQTDELAGPKQERNPDLTYYRHGYNPTHIKVGKEKLKTEVPRLRHRET